MELQMNKKKEKFSHIIVTLTIKRINLNKKFNWIVLRLTYWHLCTKYAKNSSSLYGSVVLHARMIRDSIR